jgi:hypothetical protein
METFYMVYMEDGRTPVYIHTTKESAETEAKRLTSTFRKSTYILKALKRISLNEFIETDLTDTSKSELPF